MSVCCYKLRNYILLILAQGQTYCMCLLLTVGWLILFKNSDFLYHFLYTSFFLILRKDFPVQKHNSLLLCSEQSESLLIRSNYTETLRFERMIWESRSCWWQSGWCFPCIQPDFKISETAGSFHVSWLHSLKCRRVGPHFLFPPIIKTGSQEANHLSTTPWNAALWENGKKLIIQSPEIKTEALLFSNKRGLLC